MPRAPRESAAAGRVARRVARLDWERAEAALAERGFARVGPLLTPRECGTLAALFDQDRRFRSSVDMARHRFGEGRYRYFEAPLPDRVEGLRAALYPPLARIANRWAERLGETTRYPERLEDFLGRCRAEGQTRPTPLLLRYGAGGFNCLHQDQYGRIAFPLQATVLLSEPGRDFEGGEFLLLEQRPRRQSRCTAVALARGEAVLFPNAARPVPGVRGWLRAQHRHGVSEVREGRREALGVIFHDAR